MPRSADAPSRSSSLADRPEVRRLARIFADKPLTLSAYHAAGEQLRRLHDDPSINQRGSGWRAMIAELVQQSEATLNKCFQFRRCYEQEDLPELEQLDVGWSQLTVALGIPDKKKRQQLLMRASKHLWDDQDLQREVQRLKGRRRGGGRPRKRPTSHGLLADLRELIRRTDIWNDFYDTVFATVLQTYVAEIAKMSLEARDSVGEHVINAIEQLERLQERSGKALRSLAAIQRRIGHANKR